MNRSWISIVLIAALAGLLALLATLQYKWLSQISSDEHERLQKRLETDTQRFAEDFNRQMQVAYFGFQFPADTWRQQNFLEFSDRYQMWREHTAFPQLIRAFYFARNDQLFRFDAERKTFVPAEWSEDMSGLRQNLQTGEDLELIDDRKFTLSMPIYEEREQLVLRTPETALMPIRMPERYGYLVIQLDESVIKNEILPALVKKYFSGAEGAEYQLSVVSLKNHDEIVYSSEPAAAIQQNAPDASVQLFNLNPENLSFLVNRDLLTTIRRRSETGKIILNQRIENLRVQPAQPGESKVSVYKLDPVTDQPRIIQRTDGEARSGRWLLNVQHADGSLENFINNTKRRNLAISFGILALLAASVALIFISARRAQLLAQKQMDFVSAVSHEFRTPLAVIYSAGENLTDGVITTEKQIAQYGNLIKREGKKLTGMVEQILEFAGARSGRQNYVMRQTDVAEVIAEALAECDSLIREKGFTVEQDIDENLPLISADANALSHSIQNLITNAVKYSDREKWIRISAGKGEGELKISIEDRGIGISPKDAAQIFSPFYRAKSVVDAQIHGNGLGLSLVDQTVRAHGGKVRVESEPGKGSKFIIHLPLPG